MRQYRNMFQMKEQEKAPKEELSEIQVGNFPEKQPRIKTAKMT